MINHATTSTTLTTKHQRQQSAMIQAATDIPQQSSSSYEDPTQVNTSPGRARIPEDEEDTRTVRPRLDLSALICEMCQRDVPDIDREKLGKDSSYLFVITLG